MSNAAAAAYGAQRNGLDDIIDRMNAKQQFKQGVTEPFEKAHAASVDPHNAEQQRHWIQKSIQAIMDMILQMFRGFINYSRSLWGKEPLDQKKESQGNAGQGQNQKPADAPVAKTSMMPQSREGEQPTPGEALGLVDVDADSKQGESDVPASEAHDQTVVDAEDYGPIYTEDDLRGMAQAVADIPERGDSHPETSQDLVADTQFNAFVRDDPSVIDHMRALGNPAVVIDQVPQRIYPAMTQESFNQGAADKIKQAMARLQQDGKFMKLLTEAVKTRDDSKAAKTFMLPLYNDLNAQRLTIEASLIEEVSKVLRESGVDSEEVPTLASTLVKAMPENIAPTLLDDHVAHRVSNHFQTNLNGLGDYLQTRAVVGSMNQASFERFPEIAEMFREANIQAVKNFKPAALIQDAVFHRAPDLEDNAQDQIELFRARERL